MPWRWVAPVVFGLLCLVVWELAGIFSGISNIILPLPTTIISASIADASIFLRHSVTTLIEVIGGYLAAVILGTLCGLLIVSARLIGDAVYPTLVAFQIVPKVAITPLLVIWFGFGPEPKMILTALIAFFPVAINTVIGLNMTTRENIYLFRSIGATPLQTFWRLRLPNALPIYFGGLKVASTLAVIGVVVAEFYSSDHGLGYLLLLQTAQSQTADAFGAILYLTILGLGLFGLVVLVERLLVPAHMLKRFDESDR